MSGTVNIARDLFDHGMFKPEVFTEREAWIWLIMQARWKSGAYRAGDFVVNLERGQLAASVRFMAQAWGWTPAKVQRYQKRLINLEMISSKTDTGVTVTTICNYDKFQTLQQTPDTGPIQDRYRTDTEKKTDVIREEGKETEAKASVAKKRGSRLPDDWFLPRSWGQWAVDEGYAQDVIRTEADNFRDYWRARAGPTASKLDWEATWRIWMRKTPKMKGQRNGQGAAFGAAIHQLADRLTSGAAVIDTSSRDPFAHRRGGDTETDPRGSQPLLRSGP